LFYLLCCLRAAHALAAARPAPAAPRAAPPAAPHPASPRALEPSQCPALAARTTATAFHSVQLFKHLGLTLNPANTVKLEHTFWNFWVSGNYVASRENLN